ncbi:MULTISPECIES: DUF1772 domain-containing protein [unclassified Beijerinckia]|uniref:anthrone oxygenase family protein n=1 Tax=unclassified Beijerinckia TaxID=2638183 RepID=UPI000898C4BF|nr:MULTISPECIES: DUF1772 domain-containing protein [unclassified Beijerinckia]MDH7796228.1 hypothetical protein [Beijerinckia sp. GAS462]SEC35977.1 protein of unknown function [Beijerinckia sp. 28-YEA-48]
MAMRLLFNILAISGAAMFAGVMLAIGVILGAYWKSLPPQGFLDWFSQNNHFVAQVIPFVVAPALIGLAGSLYISWGDTTGRTLWLVASACIIAVLAVTFAYHLPSNAQFAAKAVPLDQVSGKLDSWLLLHSLRIVLALVASILGIVAIAR